MGEWISVNDKPRNDGDYLCRMSMSDQGDYSHWNMVLEWKKNQWYVHMGNTVEVEPLTTWWSVTHWMPLPEPPND